MDTGQANLLNSSVLVVGAGGLGSPALLYLAACGVGNIFLIVIFDVVILYNCYCCHIVLFPTGTVFISGRLGIVDHDVVELNNLHRQVELCYVRLLSIRRI